MGSQSMINFKKSAAILLVAAMTLIASLGAAVPAMAQGQEISPDVLKLARQYIDLTDKGSVYEVAMVRVGVDTMKTLGKQNPTVQKQLSDAIGKVLENYKGRKGELLDQFARLYAQQFTKEELQQIVDFYSTPVGAKLALANASINVDLQQVFKVFMNNARIEFLAAVRAELKTQGITL